MRVKTIVQKTVVEMVRSNLTRKISFKSNRPPLYISDLFSHVRLNSGQAHHVKRTKVIEMAWNGPCAFEPKPSLIRLH